MRTFTITTIVDRTGFRRVFTDVENGISKIHNYDSSWYDFDRELIPAKGFEVSEIQAEGFNHAKDIFRLNEDYNRSSSYATSLRIENDKLKQTILRKFGKKLKGIKAQTKINNFLR
jgi:hypothetical protein